MNRRHATLLLDALREAAASGDAVTGKVDGYGRPIAGAHERVQIRRGFLTKGEAT